MPFGRRSLLADPKRAALSSAGVGLALMLVLLLYGLWNGIDDRLVAYQERSGADLFVAQPGTTAMMGGVSVLPRSTLDRVQADPDVDWAVSIRGFFSVTRIGAAKVPSYVVGYEPGGRGGPWELASGRAPLADHEIAVGELFARRGNVTLGSELSILGKQFTVVGFAKDGDMFMASFVFMTHGATDALVHSDSTTSFVLIGTANVAAVQERLTASGLNVMTRETIERNDLALKSQAYTAGMKAMLLVAFGVGCIVVALTTYTSVVDRRRDYGIIKALGASRTRLYGIVIGQSCALSFLGLGFGIVFFLGGRQVIDAFRPEFAIAISAGALGKAAVAALVMGILASAIPARRLAVIEPAAAFGGA